jgi:hypothetical protein
MKTALLKYYVVYCIKTDRREKAIEFLANYALPQAQAPTQTQGQREMHTHTHTHTQTYMQMQGPAVETDPTWRQWFVLPHLKVHTHTHIYIYSIYTHSQFSDKYTHKHTGPHP